MTQREFLAEMPIEKEATVSSGGLKTPVCLKKLELVRHRRSHEG
jgi:hypothetical protein